MKILLNIVALAALFSLVGLTGCEEKTPTEKAGDAVEKAGDKVEDAADKAGDAVEDAGDKVKDGTGG